MVSVSVKKEGWCCCMLCQLRCRECVLTHNALVLCPTGLVTIVNAAQQASWTTLGLPLSSARMCAILGVVAMCIPTYIHETVLSSFCLFCAALVPMVLSVQALMQGSVYVDSAPVERVSSLRSVSFIIHMQLDV